MSDKEATMPEPLVEQCVNCGRMFPDNALDHDTLRCDDCLSEYLADPVLRGDQEETMPDARDVIEAALNDYRTSHWHDDGSGMALIDLLSPGPTVKEGQEELHQIADSVTVALVDSGHLVERDDKAALVEAVEAFVAKHFHPGGKANRPDYHAGVPTADIFALRAALARVKGEAP